MISTVRLYEASPLIGESGVNGPGGAAFGNVPRAERCGNAEARLAAHAVGQSLVVEAPPTPHLFPKGG